VVGLPDDWQLAQRSHDAVFQPVRRVMALHMPCLRAGASFRLPRAPAGGVGAEAAAPTATGGSSVAAGTENAQRPQGRNAFRSHRHVLLALSASGELACWDSSATGGGAPAGSSLSVHLDDLDGAACGSPFEECEEPGAALPAPASASADGTAAEHTAHSELHLHWGAARGAPRQLVLLAADAQTAAEFARALCAVCTLITPHFRLRACEPDCDSIFPATPAGPPVSKSAGGVAAVGGGSGSAGSDTGAMSASGGGGACSGSSSSSSSATLTLAEAEAGAAAPSAAAAAAAATAAAPPLTPPPLLTRRQSGSSFGEEAAAFSAEQRARKPSVFRPL
jgi:hypothetical protein